MSVHTPKNTMTGLLPWEAPAVYDIDIATGTYGGGTVFTDETTFATSAYAGMPMS